MAHRESDEEATLIGTRAEARPRRCVGVVFVLLLVGGACAGTALAARTAKAMRFRKAAVSLSSNQGNISTHGGGTTIGDNNRVTVNYINKGGERWIDTQEAKGLLACLHGQPGDNVCRLTGVECKEDGIVLTETGFNERGECQEITDLEKCFCAENGWGHVHPPYGSITCLHPIALPSLTAIRSICMRPFRNQHTFPLLHSVPNLKTMFMNYSTTLDMDIKDLQLPAHLTQLDLSSTDVSGDITKLKLPDHLTQLHLEITSVSGDITKLKLPDYLTLLHLSFTSVSGDIAELKLPDHLTELHLRGTSVSGDIAELQLPDHLTFLSLFADGVSGDITKLKLPDHLTQLLLQGCRSVSGDIAELKLPDHLTQLVLSSTSVSGDIAKLKLPDHLTGLYLDNTDVSGDITELKIPDHLTHLTLEYTDVSGDITELKRPDHLKHFTFYNTDISGVQQGS